MDVHGQGIIWLEIIKLLGKCGTSWHIIRSCKFMLENLYCYAIYNIISAFLYYSKLYCYYVVISRNLLNNLL